MKALTIMLLVFGVLPPLVGAVVLGVMYQLDLADGGGADLSIIAGGAGLLLIAGAVLWATVKLNDGGE